MSLEVKAPVVGATKAVEATAGELQVNLGDFIALTVPQKKLYLAALEGDARFESVLPRLKAVLAAEVGGAESVAPVAAANDSPAAKQGLGFKEVAGLLDQVSIKGYGNIDYWIDRTSNAASTVHGLAPLVAALAAREKGALRPTLEALAKQLEGVSGKGYGDLDYWSGKASAVTKAASDVANQLRDLAGVGSAIVPAKEALAIFTALANRATSQGYGDTDYWSQRASYAAGKAHLAGNGVMLVAAQLSEPNRTVIGNLGERLQAVSNGGYGDIDYWRDKTADVVKETHALAAALTNATAAF